MPDLPPTSEIARLARSPSALLNHLSNMSSDEAPDGSFQPPTVPSENGTAAAAATDAAGAVADASPAATQPEAGTDAQATPAPRPQPNHAERPQRAPQPSGVVVPGDPTLN
jgi:hypothetical protein